MAKLKLPLNSKPPFRSRSLRVRWEIDVEIPDNLSLAQTMLWAAKEARAAQARRGTTAVVFEIRDANGTERLATVDLQNPRPVEFANGIQWLNVMTGQLWEHRKGQWRRVRAKKSASKKS